MLNFTVGPVMSPEEVLNISSSDAPYFRTPEFSETMRSSERIMLKLLNAPAESRCVFLTASGTGAMESAVMSVLRPGESVAVVNGGSFGQRFVDICKLHDHPVDEINLQFGQQITLEKIVASVSDEPTALLVNMHETSSGVLYDMQLIADYCEERGMALIVDAVSAFIADPVDMSALRADVVLTGSQKALACHPGVSIMALSPCAQKRVWENPEVCKYLSLREALKNSERGQTPWTPAVTTILEIAARLKQIEIAGIANERARIAAYARAVRAALEGTQLRLVAENPSNAVSAYFCPQANAKQIIEQAKTNFNIWLCPNGGAHADDIFRIGHIGSISQEDMGKLIAALETMSIEGLF